MKIGLQVPSTTFSGGDSSTLFETLVSVAQTAEANGFDTFALMDHFFQLPHVGPIDDPMLEYYTALGAIAARTTSIKISTLVTGVTYRNPALLAKAVTTLDVVSRGRAICAIGAAWFEAEHQALGFEFPPLKERFEKLEEAIQICRLMFDNKQSTFRGKHFEIVDAFNVPRPVQDHIPLMLGGQGEKKTFRFAAKYADHLNTTANHTDIPQKMAALQGHLDDIGRSRSEIEVSCHCPLVIGENAADVPARLVPVLASRGIDTALAANPEKVRLMLGRALIGTPEDIASQIDGLRAMGIDGVTVSLIGGVADLENLALAGRTLSAAFK
ncbi:MAG: LLM class F420-dependent oxidoreductase [Actinomycetes bacterium]